MDLCLVDHHHLKINPSREAMLGLVAVLVVDAEEVTMMNITEHRVGAALQIQAGAVGLSHLRRHLHKFLLLVLRLPMSQRVPLLQALVLQLLRQRQVLSLVWLFPPLLGLRDE